MKELLESSYLNIMSEENDRLRKEIERLNNIINEFEKYLEETKGIYEEYTCAIKKLKELKGLELTVNDKKQVKWLKEEFKVRVDKPRKGEVVSLEELESYLPQNTIEEEYDDWFWS